jgi:arabinogalactan endo-1,4-beta-galactosidase
MQKLPLNRPRILAIAGALAALSTTAHGQFYMGGDVSLIPFLESRGGSFRDGGVVKPIEQIMVENGASLFRLRLFVNPNPNYSATAGAIQDLNYTIALAQRLKDSGARILLDFHYSDTWADPGNQDKPAAWAAQNWATLNQTLRHYTRDSLLAMKNAGVMPEMVQVGNEVTHGMLWGTSVNPPNGGHVVYTGSTATQNQSWMNFGSLLNSAIAGVRDVDALVPGQRTAIAIHCDGGDVQGRAQYYFNQITNIGGVPAGSYDIAGMSFYANSGSDFANLTGNLNYLANNMTKKVMVLENNYPWKGNATGAPWASTTNGQRDQLIAVRDLVRNLPNGRGAGVVWWYPEAIQVPGTFIWQGGAIALFDDSGGDALPALDEFQLPAPTWNVNSSGQWSIAGNWSGGVPGAAGAVARFGSVVTSPAIVTLDSPRTVGAISFLSAHSYAIDGAAALTLDSTSGPASLTTLAGDHSIAAPILLADDLDVVTAFTSSLTSSGGMTAIGRKITKLGSGMAQFEAIQAAALDVRFGTVRISPKPLSNDESGASVVETLSIAVGSQLDLTNNSLSIDHGGSPLTLLQDVRAHLASGRISSNEASSAMRLGYAEDLSMVQIKFTFAGDADLDGDVDVADLGRLASGWQTSGVWNVGDFDYSGFIDVADLGMLASNWQAGVSASPTPVAGDRGALAEAIASLGLPGATVPEPASALLALGLGMLLSPRSRAARESRACCRKFE